MRAVSYLIIIITTLSLPFQLFAQPSKSIQNGEPFHYWENGRVQKETFVFKGMPEHLEGVFIGAPSDMSFHEKFEISEFLSKKWFLLNDKYPFVLDDKNNFDYILKYSGPKHKEKFKELWGEFSSSNAFQQRRLLPSLSEYFTNNVTEGNPFKKHRGMKALIKIPILRTTAFNFKNNSKKLISNKKNCNNFSNNDFFFPNTNGLPYSYGMGLNTLLSSSRLPVDVESDHRHSNCSISIKFDDDLALAEKVDEAANNKKLSIFIVVEYLGKGIDNYNLASSSSLLLAREEFDRDGLIRTIEYLGEIKSQEFPSIFEDQLYNKNWVREKKETKNNVDLEAFKALFVDDTIIRTNDVSFVRLSDDKKNVEFVNFITDMYGELVGLTERYRIVSTSHETLLILTHRSGKGFISREILRIENGRYSYTFDDVTRNLLDSTKIYKRAKRNKYLKRSVWDTIIKDLGVDVNKTYEPHSDLLAKFLSKYSEK